MVIVLALCACALGCGGASGSTSGDPSAAPSQFMNGAAGGAAGSTTQGTAAANSFGAGGADAAGAGAARADAAVQMHDQPIEIAPECQGFTVRGARYSPGGSVLPNTCEPFHPTLNNPYAVRCIDAMPSFDSGFPGDEACILPPPPGKGVQLGIHPQGQGDAYWSQVLDGDMSGYANAPLDFVQAMGTEGTKNYRTHVDDPSAQAYYRIYYRLRSGGHHTIITLHNTSAPDGWMEGTSDLPGFAIDLLTLVANLGGQQRMDENVPPSLDKPAEDQGLFLHWPADPSVMINFHGFNPTDSDLLRESWVNVWWEEDPGTLAQWFLGYELPQLLTLDVPVGTIKDSHYVMGLKAETRLLSVLGHRHAWTSNMSAWVKHLDGSTEVVYQSFDWADIPTYRYDSLVENPPVASDARVDGAASGVVTLVPGDELHFNCHVEYTDERAALIGAPLSPAQQGPLRFSNEVFTGEMCVLFGTVVGDPFVGFPVLDLTPPPAFATVD